jgi:hypothetical protein
MVFSANNIVYIKDTWDHLKHPGKGLSNGVRRLMETQGRRTEQPSGCEGRGEDPESQIVEDAKLVVAGWLSRAICIHQSYFVQNMMTNPITLSQQHDDKTNFFDCCSTVWFIIKQGVHGPWKLWKLLEFQLEFEKQSRTGKSLKILELIFLTSSCANISDFD